MSAELRQQCLRRLASLQQDRLPWESVAHDIRDHIAPRTAQFEGEKPDSGAREDTKIINATAREALRTLESGMVAGITNPARPWFKFETPDRELMEFDPVKFWLYDVESILRTLFARSNFYNAVPIMYRGCAAYGSAPLTVNDSQRNVIHCGVHPFGSWWTSMDAEGRANVFYRRLVRTAAQMAEEFGRDRLSLAAQRALKNAPNERFNLIQAIEPNTGRDTQSKLSRDKLYRSVIFEEGAKGGDYGLLSQSGFDEFPVFVARWDVNGDDAYASGPGEMVLGSCKALQLYERRKAQIVDFFGRPPTQGDASLRVNQSLTPGQHFSVTGMTAGNVGIKPVYEPNPSLITAIGQEIQTLENQIRNGMFTNLFMMVASMGDQPNITATQINAMREEKLLALSPVLMRLNTDVFDPLIDRVFAIALRRGLLPMPPKELQGMPLKIEYENIFSMAMRAMGIGAIERVAGYVTSLAAANPTILDKFDFDQSVDEVALMSGVPPRLIVSDERVAQIRQDRAKQQQQAQMAAVAPQVAKAAKDAADIPIDEDNALTRAMGLA